MMLQQLRQDKRSSTWFDIVHANKAETWSLSGYRALWIRLAYGMICGFLNANTNAVIVSSHGQLVEDSGSISIALSVYQRQLRTLRFFFSRRVIALCCVVIFSFAQRRADTRLQALRPHH